MCSQLRTEAGSSEEHAASILVGSSLEINIARICTDWKYLAMLLADKNLGATTKLSKVPAYYTWKHYTMIDDVAT